MACKLISSYTFYNTGPSPGAATLQKRPLGRQGRAVQISLQMHAVRLGQRSGHQEQHVFLERGTAPGCRVSPAVVRTAQIKSGPSQEANLGFCWV